MRVLKLRGGISSLLFEFVDFERLKQEEFRILEAMADFKWIFVHDSIRRTFSSLLDSHLEQNSLIAVLKIEFSRCLNEIDGLKSNILNLEERLASLSVSGSLREDEMTRKMADLEKRLDSCDLRSQQQMAKHSELIETHHLKSTRIAKDLRTVVAELKRDVKSTRFIIKVLHVCPCCGDRASIDLRLICDKDPYRRIRVTQITPAGFVKQLGTDKHLLLHYEVVIVGGCDSCYDCLKDITPTIVIETFVPYHEHGGNLLFMHDVVYGTTWDALANNPSFKKGSPLIGGNLDSVQIIRPDAPVLKFPFAIADFQPTLTHGGHLRRFGTEGIVLGKRQSGQIIPYSVEFPNIGFIEIGHCGPIGKDASLQDMEWKLLVNIIHNFSRQVSS